MLLIDYYAYNNKLARLHPGEKFIFFALTLAICLAIHSVVISTGVFFLMAAVVIWAGVPVGFYLRLILIPVSFLLIGVLTIALAVSKETTDFIWAVSLNSWAVGVTAASLDLAAQLLVRCLGAVSCLYFITLTTPLVDIIYILGKIRVPALVVELMVLIYRFIFILLDVTGQIIKAQKSRLGYINVRRSFHAMSRLVLSLFVISYQQSQTMYDALVARCYTGQIKSLNRGHRWSSRNLGLIMLADGVLLAVHYL